MAQVKIDVTITTTDTMSKKDKFSVPTKTISSLTKLVKREISLDTATTLVFWDPLATTVDVMQDFDFLFVWTDGDVYLERIVDDGGEVGKVVYADKVGKDTPLMMSADDAFANVGADDAFSGTADLIERLGLRNDSGATRKITVIMAT